jgi:DNA-binding transcriptional LysR family regulator
MADLNSLVLFAKVAEANGFSEAARRLNMPVSTVSRRIADLEDQLGARLLDRSTRSLGLTQIGSEVLGHARRGVELSEAVDNIVSHQLTSVSGVLRLSAPPGISDTLLAPLVGRFQASYPDVRVQVLVTDRTVDHIAEGVDLMLRFGAMKDSRLVAMKVLTYRHQLVASPAYLETRAPPAAPQDLLGHRLLAFSHDRPENTWHFVHVNSKNTETISFLPHLSMNDYAGLATTLLAGGGIGDLPPLLQPELLQQGRLIEIMPQWQLRTFNLWLVNSGKRHIPRSVRVFKEFAARIAPTLFSNLPV